MLYMTLCGEYVRFEKFGFSGCCGGRESLSDTIRPQTLLHLFYQSVESHVGSPDEDPTAIFSSVPATHEKVAQVAKLLKEWHWIFSTL